MALTLGLDVARSSLAVTAEQISIVSRNVGRMGDADATRKVAMVVTGPGASVHVSRIGRSYDALLLEKYLSANASAEAEGAIASGLNQLQSTVNDTELGRSPAALIGKLTATLQRYSASPSNVPLAGSVVWAAQDVAKSLNEASSIVRSVRQEADNAIAASVTVINNLLTQFDAVNRQVVTGTRAGMDVTDALDARDGLLKKLSAEIGIRTVPRSDGDLAVYAESGVTMFETVARSVTFSSTSHLASGASGSPVYVDGVPVAGTNQVMSIDTGRLAGLVAVRDTLTPAYQGQIDEIARGLIEAFAEHDQSVAPTLPAAAGLFTALGGSGIPPSGSIVPGLAGLITVNANVDPSRGGDLSLIRDGGISSPGNPAYTYNSGGDASFSDRIYGMISALGTPRNFDASAKIDTEATVADFASSSVSWLEALRQNSKSEADYRQAVRERAISAFSKDTGVSLDEEMAKMLDLERTYQASSRLITTIDSMLESLLLAMR